MYSSNGLPFVELENKNYGKRKRGTPGKKKGLFQMTDIITLVRMLELCGTGKHPNINVETQIPLELDLINVWKIIQLWYEQQIHFNRPFSQGGGLAYP